LLTIGFAAKIGEGALAVGVRPGDMLLPAARTADMSGMIGRVLAGQHRFAGDDDDVLPICTPNGWLVLVGMGPEEGQDAQRLRRIGGNLFAALAESGIEHLHVALDLPAREAAELAFGMCLRAWRPPARYKSKVDPDEVWSLVSACVVTDDPAAAKDCFAVLSARSAGVALARDLVVAPANALTPELFVAQLDILTDLGVACELCDPLQHGLGLLQAVGQGSVHPPRLVVLRWSGAGAESPVVLVGKGITFDAGGIGIKPAEDMEEMKGDMAGAAAVVGALYALALRRAPVNVIGILALAENMPSGRACRPGDVVISHAGLSVEITDTDAEGRLILADALSYAAKRFRPRLIVDLATLTGAVEVALGRHRAGLFCADDALAARLFAIGEAEEEPLWRLPLTDDHDDALKSAIADLRNCDWDDDGPDALHAARFLKRFVPKGIAWAHLDIAGMSEAEEDGPLAGEGPTGFGVRLLDHLVADVFAR
jgi:leucyl aminopeptidase